jgi:hypothetical protein
LRHYVIRGYSNPVERKFIVAQRKTITTIIVQMGLFLLILVGLYLRFSWVNWSQGANLHPDEYGLTNTLTRFSLPKDINEYFNTRISTLSPYWRYDLAGQRVEDGPDNGMRWGQWPMIIIRFVAEKTGNTGYNELRLAGRTLSALADTLSLLLIFLLGRRLYNTTIGLLAAALSALAVMQIQQSHFMTVDNFAVLFAMLALYACAQITQHPCLYRPAAGVEETPRKRVYLPDWVSLLWYMVFGVAFGMALASKINLLPLGGMVLVAGVVSVADMRLRSQQDIRRIILAWVVFTAVAFLAALVTFRVTQPMSFRQAVGDTTLLTVRLNPDWIENVKHASSESSGIGGGPPGEQWTQRLPVVFPWVNMVVWGMGLPLGLASWAGFAWVAWRVVRRGENWRAHLVPLVWTGGYFAFMSTRWVMSMRYFLPIYPFLALFAALGLMALWQRWAHTRLGRKWLGAIIPSLASVVVVGGTLLWAVAFVRAVYVDGNTRVAATRWIFENVPAPFHLEMTGEDNHQHYEPVGAPDGLVIVPGLPFIQPFRPRINGQLSRIHLPHVTSLNGVGQLKVTISSDALGDTPIDEALIDISDSVPNGGSLQGEFQRAELKANNIYFLVVSAVDQTTVTVSRSVVANESWDESLPFSFEQRDPFGQLYRGVTMEVRWYDDEHKRQMFIETLDEVDYVILPSQRGIWSTCRIPRTYSMTMAYYRGLFDGSLGFELAASITAPLHIGPIQVSDVGGTLAYDHTPPLPLFNNNLLAAEEAFSIYDHPPVWVFRKRLDYNPQVIRDFFYAIDLSQVVIEGPRDASLPPCR